MYKDGCMTCLSEDIKRLTRRPLHIRYSVQNTEGGTMMHGMCDEGICWMGYDLDGAVMRDRFPEASFEEDAGITPSDMPLAVYGTDFQVNVWRELLKIPRGATIQYQEIAQNIGRPKAYRAVGTAVGANPISFLIPCHRVLPSQGGVGQYLWGSAKKASLLNSENLSI